MFQLTKVLLPIAIFSLLSFDYQPDGNIDLIPKAFQQKFDYHKVNPTVSTSLKLDAKGTVLHIPPNAFVDMAGKVVTEPVTIEYRKYHNAAEMAFSKIPMTYKGNNFNSSGMFEIRGHIKGEPVEIASNSALTIDYHLAQKNNNTDFYVLNEQSNQWVLVEELPQTDGPQDNAVLLAPEPPIVEEVVEYDNIEEEYFEESYDETLEDMGVVSAISTPDAADSPRDAFYDRFIITEPIPSIITGMEIENFGVYNFDQIYRLENKIDVVAKYQDSKGNPIDDFHSLSLIDLNFNGAFSFNPNRFICNAQGNNVLLLLNKAGDLYMLDKGEFAKMNIEKSGVYTFTLKKMNGLVDNSAALAKHLGLG